MKRDGRFYVKCVLIILGIMAGAVALTLTLFAAHQNAIVGSGPVWVEASASVRPDAANPSFYN